VFKLPFIRLDSFFEWSAQFLTEHVDGLSTAFLGSTTCVGDFEVVFDGLVGLTLGAGEDFGGWLEGGELT